MIARVWRGLAPTPGDAEAYWRHLSGSVLPALPEIRGYRGAQVLRRESGGAAEFVVTTYWDSLEAIHAFAGDDAERAVVEPAARAVLAEFDERARHYTVLQTHP